MCSPHQKPNQPKKIQPGSELSLQNEHAPCPMTCGAEHCAAPACPESTWFQAATRSPYGRLEGRT